MKKIIRPLRKPIFSVNRWLNNYEDVIWLIGDGRSGTTWVSNIINHDKKYREMFEPFHPRQIDRMSFLSPHQYIRAEDENPLLEEVSKDVFSGKFTHRRVDSGNQRFIHKGLLVKDIFANLFAYWVSMRFPSIKTVLLMRNPFSVALSKYKKKDWFWVTDPMDLLNQKDLYEDFLQPYEELIHKTAAQNDYILNQVLIWSVINYVPLRQFAPNEIDVVFYEEIFENPSREISRLSLSGHHISLDEKVISRPSKVSGAESNITQNKSPITSWQNELSVEQIDKGLKILEHFGFEKLYEDPSNPNRGALYS